MKHTKLSEKTHAMLVRLQEEIHQRKGLRPHLTDIIGMLVKTELELLEVDPGNATFGRLQLLTERSRKTGTK
jgi:hypothetical protein